MSNTFLTPSVFAKMVLVNLGEASGLKVCRSMNVDYKSEFGKKGAKIGDTLSVRKPQRFTVTPAIGYKPQGIQNIKVPVTVDEFAQVGFEWDSVEKTLSLEDANERYAKPAALALSNYVNQKAAQYIAQQCPNWVGVPGTTPTSLLTYLQAGDVLVEAGMAQNDALACIINRKMSSVFVDASKGLFNAPAVITDQHKGGRVVNQLGYEWMIDQTIYSHTVGALGGTPLYDSTGTTGITTDGDNGTSSILFKGTGSSVTNIYKKGDKFTIDGVYAVHPQTRQSTGSLKKFTVLADVTSVSTAATVTFAPGITASGQYQNVTAAPVDSAAVYFWSGASGSPNASATKVSPLGLLIHRDAFAFVAPPLENPEPGMGAIVGEATDPDTGVSISVMKAFDGVNRKEINRLDMLFGFAPLYRELSCVIAA